MTPLEVWQDEEGTIDTSLDLDGDGISREWEYALGLDPYTRDTLPVGLDQSGTGAQIFSYTRPNSLNHIQYETLLSADLENWTPVTEPAPVSSGTAGYEDINVIINHTLPEGPARYGKLKVSLGQ